ncbi:hypothetical protein NQ317_017911 [Molorchus minor]|uniref:Uncharacterized protein n=1 Tax=Molorchus minor TaxID=1323400 RepID=A0ABQ9J752_9CUCU|nr:hypothetical protein NQ317_017911 [Molorchus minor]
MKKLQSQFNFMIRVILLYFISKCLLFAYIAVKAANKEHGQSIILCGTVDSVLVVMIRGFVNIFPAIQLAVVGMFVMIIGQKFDYLSSVTNNTINNVLNEQKRYDVALINNQMVATEEENYMTNKKYYKSVQPLEVLQQASVVNFSLYTQQQIQTLTLQWSSKKAFLSAYGIINLGPWLLAPIAGNVITYLLVALQFDNVPLHDTNATIVLQSLP